MNYRLQGFYDRGFRFRFPSGQFTVLSHFPDKLKKNRLSLLPGFFNRLLD
jgi:hypothetical protein